jgi:hypothetical protein
MKSPVEQVSEKMFAYVNLTVEDVKLNPALFLAHKLTFDQYIEWYNWSQDLLTRSYPSMSEVEILKILNLFDIKFGLLYEYIKVESKLSDELLEMIKEIVPKKMKESKNKILDTKVSSA